MPQNTQITRINLTKEKRDEITVSRRADHKTVKGITITMVKNAFSTGRAVCDDKTLKHFITREDRRLKDIGNPTLFDS